MVRQTFLEEIWSLSDSAPAYIAELRRVCGFETAVTSTDSLSWLPVLFCQLYGGEEKLALPLVIIWDLLRRAARLLDDLEDGRILPAHPTFPTSLNSSIGLLATAGLIFTAWEKWGIQAETLNHIQQVFYHRLLQTCGGQHLDLTCRHPTLETGWQIVAAKSGIPLGFICWAGARIQTSDQKQLELCHQFGYHLGILDQIKDDVTDLWQTTQTVSDLTNPHGWSLPVAYATAVLPPEKQQKLQQLLQQAGCSPEAEEQARNLIIQSGAGMYLTIQSTLHYEQAHQCIQHMNLSSSAQTQLDDILNKLRLSTNL